MIYTTTAFDGDQASDHTLLVGIGMETQQVIVVDQARQLQFAASYPSGQAAPEVATLLQLPFGTVKRAVADSRYTFIPAEVYDEQHHADYERYLPFDGVGTTHIADVEALGIKLLYQPHLTGSDAAPGSDARSFPAVQALLQAVGARGTGIPEPLLVVDRHAPWMTVSLFDNGRFLYGHDLECTNEDDFSYHVLAVMNQFGLAGRPFTLALAGDIDTGDAYHNRAEAYSANVTLADSGAWTGIGVPAAVVPHQHRFLTLFGLLACGS